MDDKLKRIRTAVSLTCLRLALVIAAMALLLPAGGARAQDTSTAAELDPGRVVSKHVHPLTGEECPAFDPALTEIPSNTTQAL